MTKSDGVSLGIVLIALGVATLPIVLWGVFWGNRWHDHNLLTIAKIIFGAGWTCLLAGGVAVIWHGW